MVLPSWTETPSDSDSTIGTDDGKHHVHLVRRVACGADGDTNTGQQDKTGHHSERKAEEKTELGLPLEVAPASLGEVTGVGDLAA